MENSLFWKVVDEMQFMTDEQLATLADELFETRRIRCAIDEMRTGLAMLNEYQEYKEVI